MDVYSNAFNFNAHLNGSVDMRTGQYALKIRLAAFYPQAALEAIHELTLWFSMLHSGVSGNYGAGWRLSNTEFDPATSILTLLTGKRYQTQSLPSVGGVLRVKDQKLKDFVVKRVAESTLHVIYKDGTVEILGRPISTGPFKITAIVFENGERLSFRYTKGHALERVLDHKGEDLLVLTYMNALLVMADVRVEGGRYARTRFAYGNANNQLVSVTVPYDRAQTPPGTDAYTFVYRTPFKNGLIAVTEVKSPMGGHELISYKEDGHQYENRQYIPYVVGWRKTPGANQPAMDRRYQYSLGQNFTGFPFAGGFRPGEDNLYLIRGDYNYWSEETLIDPSNNNAPLCATRTIYNKFHLMTEQRVTREGARTITSIAYNEVSGVLFPDQPANLQLPRKITKRFELVSGGTSREEIQLMETDEYGNELSRTEVSGVRAEYSYYPIAGESGKCPADPHGLFQRYMKQERLVPAGGLPAPRLTEYTHTRVPKTGSSYFVLQESTTQAGVSSTRHTHYETPVELAGRLKSISTTIDDLTSVSEISYAITGDNLVETRRFNEREGQWLESVRMLSLVNRRLLSMTRDGGSTLSMTFDVNGRLTVETVSAGKPEHAGRRYVYHFATPTQRAHLITTDAQGTQVITYFDGFGRQVAEAQLLAGGQERVIGSWLYDAFGQCIQEVRTDYLHDGPRSLKTTYTYNRWGNLRRVVRPDGSVLVDEYDPLANLKIEGVEGSVCLKTWFNEHNQPARVKRLDVNGNGDEIESRTYDGLGRCLSVLDVGKNLTEFTYDAFNRQVTVLQKPADGTAQRLRKVEYARGTSSESATALTVDGKLVGARTYDSLGRMTSQAHGTGKPTTWTYASARMRPVAMVSPRNVNQTLTHNDELDVLIKVAMAGRPETTYAYDPVAGALMRSANGLVHEIYRDVNGHPEKEVEIADGRTLTALYGYSPGGRLLHQTAADGQRSTFDYDDFGRFSRMTTGAMVIEQSYDSVGRAHILTTTYESTQVVTRLSYDAQGREAERRFEQNGTLLQVMNSTYHPNGMLATRVLRDVRSQVVIDEAFTYDAYLRLKTYRCKGQEHPVDHRGRDISAQDFSFDSFNNIERVETTFTNGAQDICERFFTGVDPTQLTRLTHTSPAQDFTLTYDAAGNLQANPGGQVYTYNALDQLTGVRFNSNDYSYEYDAESRQVLAARDAERKVMLGYANDRLETLDEGDKKIRYFDGEDKVFARTGGVDGPQLHANDASGSVRGISAPGQAHTRRHYTPFGQARVKDDGELRTLANLQHPALNGQRLDTASGLYFLGNGLRPYCPYLMICLVPDPLSPFDEGEINRYAYCAGNPVNMMDPIGLWPSWLDWVLTAVGLAVSVVTFGYAIPAVTAAAAAYAAAATAAAAKAAAAVLVGKTISLVTATLGVVGGTLGAAGQGIAAVDKQMGWDRSHHIQNLGTASFIFSIVSWTGGGANAFRAAGSEYGTVIQTGAGTVAAFGSGLKGGATAFTGFGYSFGARQPTDFSRFFGVTRFALGASGFGQAIASRINGEPASLSTETAQPRVSGSDSGAPTSAHPLPQPAGSRFFDMPASSAAYYQAFRDEVWRIRQPILSGLIQGRGDA